MMNSTKEERCRLSLCISCTAIAGMFLSGKVLAQAVERPDLSIELIDPKVLRVCADPSNMPFSTAKGEGFENKLAELLANKLGKGLSYSWYPQATGFVRNTLAAHKCDVIMGIPQGDDLVQVTNPYYRTAYALVFKQEHGLEGVDALGDPRLKGKRIGVVAGTPPGNNMVANGLMANANPPPRNRRAAGQRDSRSSPRLSHRHGRALRRSRVEAPAQSHHSGQPARHR